MNHSNQNREPVRRASASRNVGVEEVLTNLGVLIYEYHVESTRWTHTRAALILDSARSLDYVRLDVARGRITPFDGDMWTVAGWKVLDDIQRERARRDHPAGKRNGA